MPTPTCDARRPTLSGRHPAAENIRPLLDLRHAVPDDDTHLLHVVRMALRDQLRPAASWAKLPTERWTERDARAIADVSLGVHSAGAAAYLMRHLKRYPEAGERLIDSVHHIARFGSGADRRGSCSTSRAAMSRGTPACKSLCSTPSSTARRNAGRSSRSRCRAWAVDLTGRLLVSKHAPDVQSGIELVGALRLTDQQTRLADIAGKRGAPEGQRKAAALDALANIDARAQRRRPRRRARRCRSSPFALREQSANLLARANQPETLSGVAQGPPRRAGALAERDRRGPGRPVPPEPRNCSMRSRAGKASARLLQEPAVQAAPEGDAPAQAGGAHRRADPRLPPPGKDMQDLLNRRRDGFLKAKKDVALGAKSSSRTVPTAIRSAARAPRSARSSTDSASADSIACWKTSSIPTATSIRHSV